MYAFLNTLPQYELISIRGLSFYLFLYIDKYNQNFLNRNMLKLFGEWKRCVKDTTLTRLVQYLWRIISQGGTETIEHADDPVLLAKEE